MTSAATEWRSEGAKKTFKPPAVRRVVKDVKTKRVSQYWFVMKGAIVFDYLARAVAFEGRVRNFERREMSETVGV